MYINILILIIIYILFNEILLLAKYTEEPIVIKKEEEYGSPIEEKNNVYKLWKFQQPEPWTQIIYRNDIDAYIYFVHLFIPTINHYSFWKNIMPDLDYDSNTNELIIHAHNEIQALNILYIILLHFNGQIKENDIGNLLDKPNELLEKKVVLDELLKNIPNNQKSSIDIDETNQDRVNRMMSEQQLPKVGSILHTEPFTANDDGYTYLSQL